MWLAPVLLLVSSALFASSAEGTPADTGDAYLMLEVAEPALHTLAKRQAVRYGEAGAAPRAGPLAFQYVQQPSQGQLSPVFYSYLQQVQQAAAAQQPQADLGQALAATGPQSFQDQPVLPARPPPVPEDQRRLQETLAQNKIRELEREDQTNQQLIAQGLNPTQVRRDRIRESAQRLAVQQMEEEAARQALQYQSLYQPHLVQAQPQLVQEIQAESSTPIPERLSYSQVAFGTTKLPDQRLVPGGKTQHYIYTAGRPQPPRQPQPQPQPQVVYQPQFVYQNAPGEEEKPAPVLYQPAQQVYQQQVTKAPRAGPQVAYQGVRRQPAAVQPQRTVAYQPQPQRTVGYHPQPQRTISYQPQRTFNYQPQIQRAISYQPQPQRADSYQPQPQRTNSYQPQPQRTISYQPQPQRTISYQPQPQPQLQAVYPQAEVTQKQTPDQYLIETTRTQAEPQEQVIAIGGSRKEGLSYRPEADYRSLQAALIAQHQQAAVARQQAEAEEVARQQAEAVASTTPIPRSSIYVTTARTPGPKPPQQYAYTGERQRQLTEKELQALAEAGFRMSPGSEEQEAYTPPPSPGYIRLPSSGRRYHLRPRIGKVELSQDEKVMLADNGIRGLYRIQDVSEDASPVTYVLAIDNQKRDTEESVSSS